MLLVGWAISKQASPVANAIRGSALMTISCKHLLHFSITQ